MLGPPFARQFLHAASSAGYIGVARSLGERVRLEQAGQMPRRGPLHPLVASFLCVCVCGLECAICECWWVVRRSREAGREEGGGARPWSGDKRLLPHFFLPSKTPLAFVCILHRHRLIQRRVVVVLVVVVGRGRV